LGAVEVERSFHASFGKTLGLSRKQLDAVPKGPITQAYIGHLQSVARGGSLNELVAAVLPCYWIYGEVGRRLYKKRPRKPKIYREWIETYASESFWQPVREQIQLMDRLGAAASADEKKRMNEHFILSSRYEFMFWEQAYRLESWPV
jgi:thiaminase/transcriptional activator TenA